MSVTARTSAQSDAGYCVTCPKCGKVHQKSFSTDSIIQCPRCGYEFYVYLKNGVKIEMSSSKLQRNRFYKRLQSFAASLDQLAQPEPADSITDMEET